MTNQEKRNLATVFISTSIMLLETVDEFLDSPIYKKKVKYHGNKFVEELYKIVKPIEDKLYKDDTDYKLSQEVQLVYERALKDMCDLNMSQMVDVTQFIHELKAGNVVRLSDEEIAKYKK